MMTLDQANADLRKAPKPKDSFLLLSGPETIRRMTAEIPDWLPPGVYEFTWNVPRGEEWHTPISGKVVIDPPQPKGEAQTAAQGEELGLGVAGQTLPPYIQQMFVLSQQIANIRAGAKDDFYQSTLAMMKDNQTILADERKKMREEFAEERREFLKAVAKATPVTAVEPPEPSVVEAIKEILSMEEVKPLLSLGAQMVLNKFAAGLPKDVTP